MAKRRKRNTKRGSCKGKVRYRDKQEAIRALHSIGNIDNREVTPQRAYKCPDCKGAHLTSKPRR